MVQRSLLSVAAVFALAMSADSTAQNRTPIPDLSGNWAHPFLTGFEPPASGPGPVLNRSRRPDGVANFQQLVGDHTNPILKPHAAEIVKKHGEQSLSGIGYPTPSNQCRPQGVPYIFWDFTMQMLPSADHITMVYRQGNETRRIRMNQSHPAVVTPSWYGDSVGRYEGDTLVIDTIGVKVGPYPMLDMYGTPFSEKLHVIERYTRVGEKTLLYRFTIEDPGTWERPWTGEFTWPATDQPIYEYACHEANYAMTGILAGARAAEKAAADATRKGSK